MNDEHQKPSGLDEKKKSALIHYVAILFIVAFILVLISMLGTMRDSREDISALTQSSVSALQKAEQLQNDNESLREENAALKAELEAQTAAVSELEDQLTSAVSSAEAASDAEAAANAEARDATNELTKAIDTMSKMSLAYEDLIYALQNRTPGSQEGNVAVSRALENLENLKQYLGQNGLEEYESLLEEGE